MARKTIPGVLASAGALLLAWYLLALRGDSAENLTGLLIELTGVLVEVVLIALVVDVLAESRERKGWRRLHAGLAATIERSLVDLVRLNYVFVVPENADHERRTEFLDLARFSLGDLRSQVQSFTMSLEPGPQAQLRLLEERLNYLLRSFHSIALQIERGTPPRVAYETQSFFAKNINWETLILAADDAALFLAAIKAGPGAGTTELARSLVGDRLSTVVRDAGFGEAFYAERFKVQDELIRRMELDYVLLDSAGATNEAYFALDLVLLANVKPLFVRVHETTR